MIKKLKKGFTLVELIVVIAIIAILSTVAVVAYTRVVDKANVSNDTQLVRNLNERMSLYEAENGYKTPETAHDAFVLTEDFGFIIEKLTPTSSGNDIVWDMTTNRFALIDAKDHTKIIYSDSQKKLSDEPVDLWKVYKEFPTIENQKYSIYLAGNYYSGAFETKVGVDVGRNTGISSITYKNDKPQSVLMRTAGNMMTLTLVAPNDHIEHFGYAKTVNVAAVAESTYVLHGTANELYVAAGKVVIQESAVVFKLERKEIVLGEDTYPINNSSVVTNNGGNILASTIDGVGASPTFEINSLAQLKSFRDATNSGETFAGKTINLNVDITLDGPWTPISNYYRKDMDKLPQMIHYFAGTFNGNNHVIKGLTNIGLSTASINTGYDSTTPSGVNEYVYGFFASVGPSAVIKNIKFSNVNIGLIGGLSSDRVAAAVGYYHANETTYLSEENISGITVSGSILGYDGVGGIVGGVGSAINAGYFKISNSTIETGTTIKGFRKTGGIVGFSSVWYAEFNGVKNFGTVASIDGDPQSGSANYYSAGGVTVMNADVKFMNEYKFIGVEVTNRPTSAKQPDYVGKFAYIIQSNGISSIDENGTYVNNATRNVTKTS